MFIGKSRLRRFLCLTLPGRHPSGRPPVDQTRSCAFVGHQLRFRRQKAWFLPAAQQGETQVRQVPRHRDILGSTGIGVRPIT